MHFPSLHSWFRCSVCFYLKCSSSHNKRVIQRVKKHFFCQNLFQLMYNHKPKSNVHLRKKHKTPDRKGGSTLFFPPKVNADCELCRQSVLHTVQVLNTMSCTYEICALYRFLDTEKIAVCNITAMHASPCSLLRTVTTDINYFQCSLYTRSFEC